MRGLKPTFTLTSSVWPTKWDKVTVFSAYLDDSGNPTDPAGGTLTIAGYSSDVGGWAYFEQQWSAVLDRYGAPYLHMKEFGDRNGIYQEIKSSPDRERSFIFNLVQVIQCATEFAASSTVVLGDLQRFNDEHELMLDPYSLCIYGCLLEFSAEYKGWDQPIAGEMWFDRFDRASSRIAQAEEYAATDIGGHFGIDEISASPVKKSDTFRNILPLQAADFLAWESRKRCVDLSGWAPSVSNRRTLEATEASYRHWASTHNANTGQPPRPARKSYAALKEWPRPQGTIWRYAELEAANRRHPNGWEVV